MYCLDLLEMSVTLAVQNRAYEDVATKFFEHFAYIASAVYRRELWDDEDGFYYDVLQADAGWRVPLRVRSMVGLLPVVATTTLGLATLAGLPDFANRAKWFADHKADLAERVTRTHTTAKGRGQLLSIVSPEQLDRVLRYVLDETEFLSPHGLSALTAHHREHPFTLDLAGMEYSVDYEPGESTSGLFGGNSNWRGPVWFPVNFLVMEALRRFGRFFGESITVVATTTLDDAVAAHDHTIEAARQRVRRVVASSGPNDDVDRMLPIAADQFVVGTATPAVVAGYPWFGAWSRDTMTSYEELFLAVGRANEGRALLVAAAVTVRRACSPTPPTRERWSTTRPTARCGTSTRSVVMSPRPANSTCPQR